MWAAQLNNNLGSIQSGKATTATIGKSGQTDFSELSLAPQLEEGVYSTLDHSGIRDPLLRHKLEEYLIALGQTSPSSRTQIQACLNFLTNGLEALSLSECKLVRETFQQIGTSALANALGLSFDQIQTLKSVSKTLSDQNWTEGQTTSRFKNYYCAQKNISPAEMEFRSRMYLVDSKNNDIELMSQELFRTGALRQGMSDKEIASAVLDYMQTHFTYIKEGKSTDYWQSIEETVIKKGGDCEDLAILQASLLMNVLKKEGYSDAEVSDKVSLAAGYVTDKRGNRVGHMVVKRAAGEDQFYALDATDKKNKVIDFEDAHIETLFEANDEKFVKLAEIDPLFQNKFYLNNEGWNNKL